MSSTGAQRRPAGLSLHRFDPPSSAGASSSKRDSQSITGGATALLTGMGGASSVSSAAGGSGGAGAAGAGAGEGKRKDVEGITSPGELTVFVDKMLAQLESKFEAMSEDVLVRMNKMSDRIDHLETTMQEMLHADDADAEAHDPAQRTHARLTRRTSGPGAGGQGAAADMSASAGQSEADEQSLLLVDRPAGLDLDRSEGDAVR